MILIFFFFCIMYLHFFPCFLLIELCIAAGLCSFVLWIQLRMEPMGPAHFWNQRAVAARAGHDSRKIPGYDLRSHNNVMCTDILLQYFVVGNMFL